MKFFYLLDHSIRFSAVVCVFDAKQNDINSAKHKKLEYFSLQLSAIFGHLNNQRKQFRISNNVFFLCVYYRWNSVELKAYANCSLIWRVIKISTIYVMCSPDLIDHYGFIYSIECFSKVFFLSHAKKSMFNLAIIWLAPSRVINLTSRETDITSFKRGKTRE